MKKTELDVGLFDFVNFEELERYICDSAGIRKMNRNSHWYNVVSRVYLAGKYLRDTLVDVQNKMEEEIERSAK